MIPKISFCTIIKNEEEYIKSCIESIMDIVSEIVIADTGCTDKSIEIAKSYGAKIIPYNENHFDFSRARNLSLQNAKGDWILTLDADEAIDYSCINKIIELVQTDEKTAYFFERYDYLKEGGWFIKKPLRLFKNSYGIEYNRLVAENLIGSLMRQSYKFVNIQDIFIHHFGRRKKQERLNTKKNLYCELAEKHLEESLCKDAKMYGFLGESYLLCRDYVNALLNYNIAEEIQSSLYVRKRVNDIYYKMGHYDKWLEGYKLLIESNNFEETELNNTRGHYFYLIGNYDKAKSYYLNTPESCHKYINLGLCFENLGFFKEAMESYEKAISINPLILDLPPLEKKCDVELFNDTNWAYFWVPIHKLFCYVILGDNEEALSIVNKYLSNSCSQKVMELISKSKKLGHSNIERGIFKFQLFNLIC